MVNGFVVKHKDGHYIAFDYGEYHKVKNIGDAIMYPTEEMAIQRRDFMSKVNFGLYLDDLTVYKIILIEEEC